MFLRVMLNMLATCADNVGACAIFWCAPTSGRVRCGVEGRVVLALLVAAAASAHAVPFAVLACAAWLLGDGIERHLFFRAAVAPRMP